MRSQLQDAASLLLQYHPLHYIKVTPLHSMAKLIHLHLVSLSRSHIFMQGWTPNSSIGTKWIPNTLTIEVSSQVSSFFWLGSGRELILVRHKFQKLAQMHTGTGSQVLVIDTVLVSMWKVLNWSLLLHEAISDDEVMLKKSKLRVHVPGTSPQTLWRWVQFQSYKTWTDQINKVSAERQSSSGMLKR